jgi:hypothetical protein
MTMRFYEVEIERGSRRHVLRVPSETDVQAADAAASRLVEGDVILSITEVADDGLQRADALPALSQAAEVAEVSPGEAAATGGRRSFAPD